MYMFYFFQKLGPLSGSIKKKQHLGTGLLYLSAMATQQKPDGLHLLDYSRMEREGH